jgi:GTPase
VPYARGDLLDRLHQHGEIESLEHTGDGTVVRGRVNADLAGVLEPYLLSRA